MNKKELTYRVRQNLALGRHTIGSWMQIPHPSIAEIMGQAGYDWVTVDMEHGSIAVHQLPDLFRAIELGGALPFARLAQGHPKDCKQALDAGAAGIIVPMIESAKQLESIRSSCCWPPSGHRGVGFSRANLFGKNFEGYLEEAQAPFLVAMIESKAGVENLRGIVQMKGLDAVFLGPYDLSASLGLTGQFNHPKFVDTIKDVLSVCNAQNVPCGIHVVMPNPDDLRRRLDEGYRFISYSIDAVFLTKIAESPERGLSC